MSEVREKHVELSIIQYIQGIGGWAQKLHSGAIIKAHLNKHGVFSQYRIQLADEGSPDIVACLNGNFIAIEVKRSLKEIDNWWKQKDQRSQSQFLHLDKIDKNGGHSIITHSLDDFIGHLEAIKKKL